MINRLPAAFAFLAILFLIGIGYIYFLPTRSEKSAVVKAEPVAKRILYVPWGSEKGSLTFSPVTQGREDEGPRSFFISDKEEIYVLDTVKRKINIYAQNQFVKELKLSTLYYPHDIYIFNNFLYLLTDMSLDKLTHSGELIKSNKNIRNNVGLTGNTGRIFKHKNILIISSQESTKGNGSACFDTEDIEPVQCQGVDDLFKEHEVVDSVNDKVFITMADGRLGFVDNGSTHNVLREIRVNNYTNGGMFPVSTLFRIRQDKIYTMNPQKNGISFYERKFE